MGVSDALVRQCEVVFIAVAPAELEALVAALEPPGDGAERCFISTVSGVSQQKLSQVSSGALSADMLAPLYRRRIDCYAYRNRTVLFVVFLRFHEVRYLCVRWTPSVRPSSADMISAGRQMLSEVMPEETVYVIRCVPSKTVAIGEGVCGE